MLRYVMLRLLFWRVSANCGGVINLASGASHTIKSPGYDSYRYYLSHQGCSWWLKVKHSCCHCCLLYP